MSTIQAIIDRAASDPDFLQRLAESPIATAEAEGYEVSAEEVKAMLGLPEASEREVVEALQARLSHAGKGGGSFNSGYGGFGGGAGLVGNSGGA